MILMKMLVMMNMNGCVIGNRWAGFAGVTSFAQSANSKSPKTEEIEKVMRRRMTQVWTLMIDNRTQSFCQFVLPWNFSLSTETTEKVFLAGLPCLGLTIS